MGLYTRREEVSVTAPICTAERIMAVSEALDFPDNCPPAEMLLGGECRAVVRECKLLPGKAIVKGEVYIHQLYADETLSATHCLDYTVPFSQILDVDGACEGQQHTAHVLLLSDTQRCTVGQDGTNTVLEVTVKLLVQLQVYETVSVPLLLDAYHSRCPVTLDTCELPLYACMGSRWETANLPMQMDLPAGQLAELMDVWIQPQILLGQPEDGVARLTGRMLVCVLARDTDGQIAYYERPEEYQLEYPCEGNKIRAKATVTDLRYRVTEGKLEMQVQLHIALQPIHCWNKKCLCRVDLHSDTPYPARRVTAMLYYADGGERVWEIGRECHASPALICEENALTADTIPGPCTLVVPLV